MKRGDTLSAIAARYRTAANVIAEANKLPNPNTLVVGQTLVIPIEGQYYEVKQGDTLASIAGRFHISAAELARVNGIQPGTTLRVGTRLYIPQQANKPDIESNAYIEPRGTSVSANLQQAAREASPYLTYLGAFSFQVQRNGTLKEPPLTNLKASVTGTTPL